MGLHPDFVRAIRELDTREFFFLSHLNPLRQVFLDHRQNLVRHKLKVLPELEELLTDFFSKGTLNKAKLKQSLSPVYNSSEDIAKRLPSESVQLEASKPQPGDKEPKEGRG